MGKRNITIKELADILNVSISTVSKALNDSHEIGDKTKAKVKEIATLYNYRPNFIAKSLKDRTT
ncbi:MAG: LacI family transcriptional regulator, partial [Sphingobacteriales bacterium]